jgi:putative membrane protein
LWEAVRPLWHSVRMYLTGQILAGLIAALHLYILVTEMFLWTTPRTRASFGVGEQLAVDTKVMAANQGLYNGFLAAGLVWGLIATRPTGFAALVFFLACVAVAGIYGGLTVTRRILLIQTVPALVALGFLLLGR